NSCGSTALFARLLFLASRSIARRLLRAREALMFLPAFGTFLGVVSAFVMSHKPDLRPLLDREQSKRLGRADIARQTAKDNGEAWNLNTIRALFRAKPRPASGLLVRSMMRYLRRRILNFGDLRIPRSRR